jgi:uncharacterized protein (TIGR03067 family)
MSNQQKSISPELVGSLFGIGVSMATVVLLCWLLGPSPHQHCANVHWAAVSVPVVQDCPEELEKEFALWKKGTADFKAFVDKKLSKHDAELLQGTWEQSWPDTQSLDRTVTTERWTIDGNKLVKNCDDWPPSLANMEYVIKINPNTTPKRMDLLFEGKKTNCPVLAIYSVTETTLKVTWGSSRPTSINDLDASLAKKMTRVQPGLSKSEVQALIDLLVVK